MIIAGREDALDLTIDRDASRKETKISTLW
jgi:hypothetical protein